MNKRSFIAEAVAYSLTILIIFLVILSHGTLSASRILFAIAALILGVCAIYYLNVISGKNITLRTVLDKKIKDLTVADIIGFIAITIAAVLIRVFFYPYLSPDVAIFQENWYATAKSAGWSSLGMGISDYPPLYTTVFCILCQLPLSMMFVTKIVPVVFDFVLAIAGLLVFNELKPDASVLRKLTVYAVLLLNPIMVLNASAWGQCDGIYSSFILIFLVMIIKMYKNDKGNGDLAFVFLGLALACKLQTVFILPVIIFILIIQKKKVLKTVYFVWLPVIYFASCIPMFLAHRTIKDLFGIYFFQTGQYESFLSLNYPNFYSFFGNVDSGMSDGLSMFGILTAVSFIFLIYLYFYKKNISVTADFIVRITSLTILILVFFIPSMHERYAIVGEILLMILACVDLSYILPAVVTVILTTFDYANFLLYYYEITVPAGWIEAALRLAVIGLLTVKTVIDSNINLENTNDQKQLS